MAVAACPACGGAFGERIPYPGAQAGRYSLSFGQIAVCAGCGLGMALPRHTQAELDAFYATGSYWSDAVGRTRSQNFHERNQCRHRVARALGALGKASALRVLDVGAGHGWTAHWLERLAPGAVAAFDFIEPDEACSREILARRPGPGTTRLASLAVARAGYHLVFLNHVLEHMAEPAQCVASISALLAPGGAAYFEMPHADQRFKADVFPHTWFFTPAALGHLAAGCGVAEVLREAFGRMPSRRGLDLVWRAAFRASAALGLAHLAGALDDRVWRYEAGADGIWLRWILARDGRAGPALTPASPPG
jgi:N-acetylglucosaminyldiphosphoundecaprenol N-acetyl-beta-D-mannosaminyltransferase